MRKMSASVDQRSDGALPTAFPPSDDALSEPDDGSSSLSDIEDKEAEQDDLDGGESENDIEYDANDSEAETERLENSPHNQRKLKDVVLSSQAESRTYERSPSKLQHQFQVEADGDDDQDMDELSDDDISVDKSTKSPGSDEAEQEPTTATTSIEDSSGDGKLSVAALEAAASKKRKRSLLPDPGIMNPNEAEEPARKRTGSIGAPEDEYAVDDTASVDGEMETSNPISGNISDADSLDPQDDEEDENQQQAHGENGIESGEVAANNHTEGIGSEAEKKKGWKKRRSPANDVEEAEAEHGGDAEEELMLDRPDHEPAEVEETEEAADVEGDEVAAKNEEEPEEKKKLAMDQLSDIERHFASFRDRLYEERLAQLDAEEAMLKQDKPTHPAYLAMLQAVDARRDEKLRIEARSTEFRLESIKRTAVARRSQILAQFYQEVREAREKKLEILGRQWYDIQHDRRGYGSNVEDYILKFPTKRSQQIMQQLAYNTEVSLLSGVAKYVGFPAAPPMSSATAAETEHDFEKISRTQVKQQSQRIAQGLSFPELAALRTATSTTSFKPAEERFIEQTPWANPHHPSHAHILQHQALGQQPAPVSSPFSVTPAMQARRLSHQHAARTPISGTFSGATQATKAQTNGAHVPGEQSSPMNPFANPSLSQKVEPSPLGSRHLSLSPQQSKLSGGPLDQPQHQGSLPQEINGNHPAIGTSDLHGSLQKSANEAIVTAMSDQSLLVSGRI